MADSFPKTYRLLSSSQFDRVFRRRCSAADDVIVVYACENDLPHPRLGMAVSRKVGNAVVRNSWKRRIREAFRLERAGLPLGIDLVVIPRRGVEPSLDTIQSSLPQLAKRLVKRLEKSAK